MFKLNIDTTIIIIIHRYRYMSFFGARCNYCSYNKIQIQYCSARFKPYYKVPTIVLELNIGSIVYCIMLYNYTLSVYSGWFNGYN